FRAPICVPPGYWQRPRCGRVVVVVRYGTCRYQFLAQPRSRALDSLSFPTRCDGAPEPGTGDDFQNILFPDQGSNTEPIGNCWFSSLRGFPQSQVGGGSQGTQHKLEAPHPT